VAATRRLVAIFYADVAGYSRLTGADEEGAHRRVMAVLDRVAESITAAGGDVLRYTGDAILAVFPSVVLAVDSSAAIQTDIAEHNAGVAQDERVQLRVGINVGDVIEDRGVWKPTSLSRRGASQPRAWTRTTTSCVGKSSGKAGATTTCHRPSWSSSTR